MAGGAETHYHEVAANNKTEEIAPSAIIFQLNLRIVISGQLGSAARVEAWTLKLGLESVALSLMLAAKDSYPLD